MEEVITLDKNGLGHLWGRIKQLVENLVGGVERYPVGSIYLSVNNENPSKYFGGTWVAWGAGRVPVGVDTTQTEFNAVQKTGGNKSHYHRLPIAVDTTVDNWSYMQWNNSFAYGTNSVTSPNRNKINNTPEGTAMKLNQLHSQTVTNLPPYITCYMWRRTA